MQNKRYFLDFLSGKGSVNVIFEPFISRAHTETLIWRRGAHLWETPAAYVDTLFSLSPRTRSDVVFCDMRAFPDPQKEELLRTIENFRDAEDIGFGVICEVEKDLFLAERCPAVITAAVYGGAVSKRLPLIRMDGTLEDAIARNDAGWYASDDAAAHLKKAEGRIRILGGLGRQLVLATSPVEIYGAVADLAAEYPGQWACGSGFEIPDDRYLELISVLGAFGRIR